MDRALRTLSSGAEVKETRYFNIIKPRYLHIDLEYLSLKFQPAPLSSRAYFNASFYYNNCKRGTSEYPELPIPSRDKNIFEYDIIKRGIFWYTQSRSPGL